MSIIITNISDPPTPKGENMYRIRINDKVITTFTHNREDGLAVCLRKAGEAVEENDVNRIIEIYLEGNPRR